MMDLQINATITVDEATIEQIAARAAVPLPRPPAKRLDRSGRQTHMRGLLSEAGR